MSEIRLCSKCQKPLSDDLPANRFVCDACKKDKRDLFYVYSELRFDFWNFIHNNGVEKAKEFYYKMCAEEGDTAWVNDALGNEILTALGIIEK